MARLRAVEHGRAVLVAATSGISAVVSPGRYGVVASSKIFTQTVLVDRVPLRDSRTLADRLGAGPEWRCSRCSALWAVSSPCVTGRRSRRQQRVSAERTPRRPRGTRPHPGDHPDVQRAREHRDRSSAGCARPCPSADLLVVDDNSPDGTGEHRRRAGGRRPTIHVLHRAGQGGPRRRLPRRLRLGAGAAATTSSSRWTPTARTSPSSCRGCSTALRDADLVLGSRWVAGGTVVNWPAAPQAALARRQRLRPARCSACRLHDCTGGFRAYRAAILEGIELDEVASQGYCFQVDLAWRACRSGFRVVEVPITFVERERGESR